jgi:O-methyltransferase involved in polyketide biosynthesis
MSFAAPPAWEPGHRLRLGHTASLVMAWAKPLYSDGKAGEFVGHLDLAAGSDLLSLCHDVCPWYKEVILNRKSFIRHLAAQELATRHDPCQVVIPAAGASPLGLELLAEHPDKISRIIELDTSGMEEKLGLYARIAPNYAPVFKCLSVDVTSTDFRRALVLDARYEPHESTIVILEGISYYVSRMDLTLLLGSFYSEAGRNRVIMEYLLPDDHVCLERRHIPAKVFQIIQEHGGLPDIQRYAPEDVGRVLRDVGGCEDAHYTMTDMERHRTGASHYFAQPQDGWIGCTTGLI